MVSLKETTESVSDSSFEIFDAGVEDIPSIMEIQRSLLKKPESLSIDDTKRGFLVYEVGEDELRFIMTSDVKHIIKIVKRNNIVMGYFIGYDMKYYLKQHPEWIDEFEDNSGGEFKKIFKGDNVLFSKQLALKPNAKKSGLGSKIYEVAYQDAISLGFRQEVGEVLAEPIRNSAMESLVFNRLNFKLAGFRSDKNRIKWSVITRPIMSR